MNYTDLYHTTMTGLRTQLMYTLFNKPNMAAQLDISPTYPIWHDDGLDGETIHEIALHTNLYVPGPIIGTAPQPFPNIKHKPPFSDFALYGVLGGDRDLVVLDTEKHAEYVSEGAFFLYAEALDAINPNPALTKLPAYHVPPKVIDRIQDGSEYHPQTPCMWLGTAGQAFGLVSVYMADGGDGDEPYAFISWAHSGDAYAWRDLPANTQFFLAQQLSEEVITA